MNGKEIAKNLEIAYQDEERKRMLAEAEYAKEKWVLEVSEWKDLCERIIREHQAIIEAVNQ